MRPVLGLDIGGANLKAAHCDGTAQSQSFAVWRRAGELEAALRSLMARMPAFDTLAVTMTAELCDCFETKRHGVLAVLDAVHAAARAVATGASVVVWLNDGRLVAPAEARTRPYDAAASNWLALATWAGRLCPSGPALLLDIGSTTSDIVPLRDGIPVPAGRTDLDRLASGELVYSGARRTPVAALVRSLCVRGRTIRVAAELFATTLDAHVVLGDMPEEPGCSETADGRPATRLCARDRLARMIGADRTMISDADAAALAAQVAAAQLAELRSARTQVERSLGERARTAVVAGSGEFLARRVLQDPEVEPPEIVSLAQRWGSGVAAAACAYALAVLAAERREY